MIFIPLVVGCLVWVGMSHGAEQAEAQTGSAAKPARKGRQGRMPR